MGDWKNGHVGGTGGPGADFAGQAAPPADGETWRLNVTRDRTEPAVLSAWPALSAFADTERHGTLTFIDAGAVVCVAPSWAGVRDDGFDLTATLSGARLAAPTTLVVETMAVAAGRPVVSPVVVDVVDNDILAVEDEVWPWGHAP